MYRLPLLLIVVLISVLSVGFSQTLVATAQDKTAVSDTTLTFTTVKEVESTSVKDQGWTPTCWCFSTISFLESELLRMGKDTLDLSEMFIVRHTYPRKAVRYVRLHGNTVFAGGGLSHDVMGTIREAGLVPEEIYEGRRVDATRHDHNEMAAVLKGAADGIVKNTSGRLTPVWPTCIEAILDTYLGKPPASFVFHGEEYTPESFLKELGLDPDAYVEITSFTHHPLYSRFILELPDNWALSEYYNVPLDDFMLVIDRALGSGYSIVWDGDTSEWSFGAVEGVALLPAEDWRDEGEGDQTCGARRPEKEVTQEVRQELFDNYSSTDNHLMHIIGTAEDQDGKRYYIAKDSFGEKGKKYGGLMYLSEAYVRAKTIAIMVHTNAIPRELRRKLSIDG